MENTLVKDQKQLLKEYEKSNNLPPGSGNPILNAFNIVRADFLGKAVFDPTYKEGKTVKYGPVNNMKEYSIPDEITFQTEAQSSSQKDTRIFKNKADYDETISASFEAEYSGVSFSGSASGSVMYHGSMFSDMTKNYALNFDTQLAFVFRRNGATHLTEDFKNAIASLPDQYSLDNKKQFTDFFDTYGTHYLKHGFFGGYMVMQSSISESLFNTQTDMEITAGISAGYDGLVASGSMKAEGAYKSSEFLEKYEKEISIETNVYGGIKGDNINEYFQSVYDNPKLLLNLNDFATETSKIVFTCLSELLEDSKKEAFIEALKDYSEYEEGKDGVIADAVDVSLNESIPVANDLFVTSIMEPSPSVGIEQVTSISKIQSDNTLSPTDVKATISALGASVGSAKIIYQNTCFVPVQEGTHLLVTSGDTSVYKQKASQWGFAQPGTNSLGKWTEIEVNESAEFTPPGDGFLLLNLEKDNTDKWISWMIHEEHGSFKEQIGALSNSNAISPSTTCVPVKKGGKITFSNSNYESSKTPKGYYIDLVNYRSWLDLPQTMEAGVKYQAETDGFVVVQVGISSPQNVPAAQASYSTAYVETSWDNQNYKRIGKTTTEGPVLPFKMKPYEHKGKYSTMTIPVSKGKWYRVNFEARADHSNIIVQWHPYSYKE